MIIPFIQHKAVGLHITDRAIRWVELSRIRKRISVDRVEQREIPADNLSSVLKTFIEELDPAFPYVTTNIDPGDVDVHILEVPFTEDEQELRQWINETTLSLLPAEAKPDEYSVAHHLFGDPETLQQCLFLITPIEVAHQRIQLLESVGLKPVILTAGLLEPAYAVMFDQDFSSGPSWLLAMFEDQTVLQYFQNGGLEQVRSLMTGRPEPHEVMAEAESLIATDSVYREELQQEHIFVLSDQAAALEFNRTNPDAPGSKTLQVRSLVPLSHQSNNNEPLPADTAVACGMALKHLYPSIDTLNLLKEDQLQLARQQIEKKDAFHTLAGLGGVLGAFFLILTLLHWILSGSVEQADNRVAMLEDKIAAVSEARNHINELKRYAAKGKQLVAEQTTTGRVLETVGNILPEGLWLNELLLDATNGSKDSEIVLYGFAWNDALVAVLLERFEEREASRNVRLVYSEQVRTEEIYGDRSYAHKDLVRFEVRTTINQQKITP